MRPTAPITDTRRVWPLTLKVSLAESEVIRKRATAQGVPLGRYLRECALNGHIVVTHPIAATQWSNLARLAGNLNTLTRHCNQGRIAEPKDITLTLTELSQLLAEVRAKLIA